MGVPGAPVGDAARSVRDLGRPQAAPCSRPGTSSSRARRAPTSAGRPPRSSTAPSPPPPSGCRPSRRWASTCSTCRRSTRSAGSTARAATTRWSPGRTTSARRGRSASAEGGHDAIHPRARHAGGLPATSSQAAARRRPGGRAGPGAAVRARPPVGHRAPGVVHHAADGTIAYAENPPKKYQDIYPLNFDNDPAGPARGGAAGRPALGARRASRSSGWTTRTPSR